ncbi:uncharacterized protein LOC106417726 [Brassica napus]|nr:uncharacterized protein LOC106417726 [Brassica napus]XP_048625425.1 uncharacterized protein LOC106417726 [Brassica napus]XP_048625426.1 uncharacterized protein LOC106417726 [Brassica napus]
MMVANGEESAVFVAFDTAITKLTNARATEVSNPIGYGEQDSAEYNLPYFLQDIVRKSYISSQAYRVNFSFLHELFTVARIFDPIRETQGPPLHCMVRATIMVTISLGKIVLLASTLSVTPSQRTLIFLKLMTRPLDLQVLCKKRQTPTRWSPIVRMFMIHMDHHKEGPQRLVFTMERNRGTNVSPMHIVKALTLCFSK